MQKHKRELAAVVLAAGLSKRMGEMKLLLPWGDKNIIQDVIDKLHSLDLKKIIVVVGNQKEDIKDALLGKTLIFVENMNYHNGSMLASLQAGLCQIEHGTDIMIVLGDQPGLRVGTLKAIYAHYLIHLGCIVIPSYRYHRGHPWIVPFEFIAQIQQMKEPDSLKDFINKKEGMIRYVLTQDENVLVDIDTPEDYSKSQENKIR